MRLSTFLLLDRDPTVPDDDPLTRAVETCVAAERAGLDGVWVAEHHFRDFGGMPNPAVLLAHVAARTERIRLGPAVSVLPFRDPRLVAEDYGLVDRLSGGRLVMGVGAGTLDF
ncbi:MAG: LLM class flavin-dependent oxidoreductase, partial [Acidobacteriota bacterium]